MRRGIYSTHTCMCILIIAFPIKVAPKKVQKGTRKWPQVIPARSNNGLGIWKIEFLINITRIIFQILTIVSMQKMCTYQWRNLQKHKVECHQIPLFVPSCVLLFYLYRGNSENIKSLKLKLLTKSTVSFKSDLGSLNCFHSSGIFLFA